MKLYTIELYFNRKKLTLIFKGGGRSSDEGGWSTDDKTAKQYLGRTKGHWTAEKLKNGETRIWLMEYEDPNFISWMWTDMPYAVGSIGDILSLPLFLGETGGGLIYGPPPHHSKGKSYGSYKVSWKVVDRAF